MRLSQLDEIEEEVKAATRKLEVAQGALQAEKENPLFDFSPSNRSLPETVIALRIQEAKDILIALEIYMDELKDRHPDA